MDPLVLALHLIMLTGPDRQVIALNPQEIVTIRTPRGDDKYFAQGIRCLIHTSDGKVVTVIDTCESVRKQLDDGGNQ